MTETQQEKLQVCENNWIRRIAGIQRIDKRRMEELREEVDVRESLTRKSKTETEMRGLREERFCGSGRDVVNKSEGYGDWRRSVETSKKRG